MPPSRTHMRFPLSDPCLLPPPLSSPSRTISQPEGGSQGSLPAWGGLLTHLLLYLPEAHSFLLENVAQLADSLSKVQFFSEGLSFSLQRQEHATVVVIHCSVARGEHRMPHLRICRVNKSFWNSLKIGSGSVVQIFCLRNSRHTMKRADRSGTILKDLSIFAFR